MSRNDMLGQAVRNLAALPDEALGVASDILAKLQNKPWQEEGRKFCRKETCWAAPPPPCTEAVRSGLLVPARESFDAEEFFLRNKKLQVYDRGNNFTRLVTGRVEVGVLAGTMSVRGTTRHVIGTDLIMEIGEGHDTYFADIAAQIDQLEKDGQWHIFPMTVDGKKWLVYFHWFDGVRGRGWDFRAGRPGEVSFDGGWQVYLRDSAPVAL